MKGGPAILPDVDNIVFPNVHELTWSSSRWVTACVLISRFPSLRRLHIGHPELELTDYVARHRLPRDFLLTLRIANRESQSCCRRQWQSLDVLRGCAVTLWTLGLAWWRHWNRGASLAGQGAGARVRRWWWNVNNWKIPEEGAWRNKKGGLGLRANDVREVRFGGV